MHVDGVLKHVRAKDVRGLDAIVEVELRGQLEFFFKRLVSLRESLVIDGVNVFEAKDRFLPGKICAAFANLLLISSGHGAGNEAQLEDYRNVLDYVAPLENESWGIYYACAGIFALKKAGLLTQAVSPEALALLRDRADWRRFVRTDDYSLIDLPTNYYGVAFSIARIRMLLGWEDASASEALLDKALHHYSSHSAGFGFCDDTDGEGRFDRYSILLIAELCERFIETDLVVTDGLRKLLRNSVDVAFKLANSEGDGFCFGRSIGPYGDTALMQILTVAGSLKVLSAEESAYAYSICSAVAEKYVGFWFNPEIHSVDMWNHGRRVDAYRGKSRIFGENLSLINQIINANRIWNAAGFSGTRPHTREQVRAWLESTQPSFSTTTFASDLYDRSLAVYRDQGRVFALLMVNGGSGQHMNSPYFPLPFCATLVEGVADSGFDFAQLMPKLILQDGVQLIGTAFFKNIRSTSEGNRHHVSYRLDSVVLLGGNAPIADGRFSSEVEYVFEPGKVTRTERFIPNSAVAVQSVVLDYLSYSSNFTREGSRVTFLSGAVRSFETQGMEICDVEEINNSPAFRSPNGPMSTHVRFLRSAFVATKPFEVQWSICYV